jgi:hypothetical protein
MSTVTHTQSIIINLENINGQYTELSLQFLVFTWFCHSRGMNLDDFLWWISVQGSDKPSLSIADEILNEVGIDITYQETGKYISWIRN